MDVEAGEGEAGVPTAQILERSMTQTILNPDVIIESYY